MAAWSGSHLDQQGFEKWISRLDKCINREGDYVEK